MDQLGKSLPLLRRRAELEQALAACDGATVRLEQTHEALRDEILRLTEELEQKNRELAHKARLADVGRIVSHVTREVHNRLLPLNVCMNLLQGRLKTDPFSLDLIGKIQSDLAALEQRLKELLPLAPDGRPDLQAINLRQAVEDACEPFAPEFAARRIETIVDIPRNVTIRADLSLLRLAVRHLALNASDSMPHGGRLVFTSYRGPRGVELEIADSGAGLSDEARLRLFEPFFSTKRDGAGLGLAVVCRIAELHGGDVVATNCPEGGAAFTLRFPDRS
jgi:signal transduction histidine kinase